MSDDHFLSAFLESRLPELGLDFETYGPYVMGVVGSDGEDDQEEGSLDDILELLQASSETHSDDEEAWDGLKQEIKVQLKQYTENQQKEEEKARQIQKQQEQALLQKEIELAKEQQQLKEEAEGGAQEEMDEAKKALMARFAYDESEIYDESGNLTKPKGGNEEDVVNNKQFASKTRMDDAKKERQKHNASKKDAREETKKAKEEKNRLKEERKKRATKGERKR
mmetsp:Transcript_22614/g.31582  ORF Transcript_22614/g.31582 Transcript_22614/m.31582 type:complete len:224 (-) Transcript_22614:66-737(-)